ncbi:hypothetical protein K2173_023160 [Erythroxylum novogranatense]|uniref:Uncharacterized protein n=1 Tax=Erythroxylum novogranatense TaxID=1862640 RepID=A0AAV8UBQ3_9ROSI|nr:hypothetical protein K2173_023160 [Erythroxylum novogranatense]
MSSQWMSWSVQNYFSAFYSELEKERVQGWLITEKSLLMAVKRVASEVLGNVKLSASPYDTAWVAMVPSREEKKKKQSEPLFPESLDWVMKHQQPDGSWCLDHEHPLLFKDSLSSTLACVLALNKWNVGEQLVNKGLEFLEANFWAAADRRQLKPIGFDITFGGMIESALKRGLNLPFDPILVEGLLRERNTQIQSYHKDGKERHLAYLFEGLGLRGNYCDWEMVMKHQKNNGSLFNSPSATAAALMHNHDHKCYDYLKSVLDRFHNTVPTAYPLDIYIQLCTVDNLQKLVIDRFFHEEIQNAMAHIYRCWLQGCEEIFSDINCLAMGFRLLRMNGYDVSSDALEQFQEEKSFFSTVSLQFENANTVLELYKASLTNIYQKEPILDRIREWTRSYLNQELRNGSFQDKRMHEEVKQTLRFRYDSLDRLEGRRNLEWHQLNNTELLKTSYRTPIDNKLFLELSLRDFNLCQSIYRKELKQLEKWVEESRIGELNFARQKLTYGYLSIAAVLIAPEDSEARISMTKNSVMSTMMDDLFDFAGSKEELENMLELFGRWQGDSSIGYCSKTVEILFSALETLINELGSSASLRQGRDVTHHIVNSWHDLLSCMMEEAEWLRENRVPTLEEYIETSIVSLALGPVILIRLFSIGPVVSEEVLASVEYHNLFRHVSLVGRLLNDLASDKREGEQGKLNSVILRMLQKSMTEEEAVSETKRLIESYRVELLRMVLETKDSEVPKACKDFMWKICHTFHFFYNEKDGYSCNTDKLKDEKSLLWEPVTVPQILSFEKKMRNISKLRF